MSKTLLIYERAVPVTKARHGKWGIKTGEDYSFAKDVNSMPLLAQEFRAAVKQYPIVFAGNEERIMPAVLLGFGENENLFVDQVGHWNASYIPAFARRYPYVFSSNDQGKTLTLCIDEEFNGLSPDGEGERLFNDDGEQTDYLKAVLEFQKDFQSSFQRTQIFCQRLKELDLLEPMQAQLKFASGEELSISGFMVVKRERLKELSGEKLSELSLIDELELIYLHLHSMQNVTDLASHIKMDMGPAAAAEAAPAGGNDGGDTGKSKPPKSNVKKKAATKSNARKKTTARSNGSDSAKP